MDCEGFKNRRVKLGYVADSPTSVQLVDSIGNQVFDMLPIVQAGETDTSIKLIPETRRIRYLPEVYTRTEGKDGCFYDICMEDIAALIYLNDLADVDSPTPATGSTIMYDASEGKYLPYDLAGELERIHREISEVDGKADDISGSVGSITNVLNEYNRRISELTELVATFNGRIEAIENAIYDWENDKTTKIARGNINVTSGGYNSGNGLYTRTPDTDEDLNFN